MSAKNLLLPMAAAALFLVPAFIKQRRLRAVNACASLFWIYLSAAADKIHSSEFDNRDFSQTQIRT